MNARTVSRFAILARVVLVAAMASMCPPADASFRVWTGAANNGRFSDPANWGGAVPSRNDDLWFSDVPSTPQVVNFDVPGVTTPALLVFGNSYRFTGLPFTVAGLFAIQGAASEVRFSNDLHFLQSGTPGQTAIFGGTGTATLTFDAGTRLVLPGGDFAINPPMNGRVVIHGAVEETARTHLILRCCGRVDFDGVNRTTGGTESSLTEFVLGPSAIGSSLTLLGHMNIAGGQYDAPITFTAPPAGTGGFASEMIAVPPNAFGAILAGPVTVTGTVAVRASGDLVLAGPVAGGGEFRAAFGPGAVVLRSGGIKDATFSARGGNVRFESSGVTASTARLETAAGGTLDIGGTQQLVAALNCDGLLRVRLGLGRVIVASDLAMSPACQLDVTPGLMPDVGGSVTLIEMRGAGPIAGELPSIAEGREVVVDGVKLNLTFRGGPFGRDVALERRGTLLGVQDMWWSGPQENGWGLSIVQHDDRLFAVVYAYDAFNRPVWYVVPSGRWDIARRRFEGAAYRPTSAPFFAYDSRSFRVGDPVGTLTLAFADADHASLQMTVDGATVRKAIIRDQFGPADATPTRPLGDMWWGGPTQDGWGLAILQQNRTLFSVWFTYDADGRDTWFVMPGGTWTSEDTYQGRIYRTRGSNWASSAPYDPEQFLPTDVGSFSIRFTATGATMDYAIDQRTGRVPLSRFAF